MLLLLLSSVHFSVCGAEGGGITVFGGLYFGLEACEEMQNHT